MSDRVSARRAAYAVNGLVDHGDRSLIGLEDFGLLRGRLGMHVATIKREHALHDRMITAFRAFSPSTIFQFKIHLQPTERCGGHVTEGWITATCSAGAQTGVPLCVPPQRAFSGKHRATNGRKLNGTPRKLL